MARTSKADARLVSSGISTDARLARLSSWKGRFLFIHMIPHADDQGRLRLCRRRAIMGVSAVREWGEDRPLWSSAV